VIEMADHPVDLLLRRGQVGSHGGDVPVTEEGLTHAVRAGTAIAALHDGPMTLLFGGTRRTRQTAEALFEGIGRPDRVSGPHDAFARSGTPTSASPAPGSTWSATPPASPSRSRRVTEEQAG
jgi:broad specificity phosphatase PhoE